MSLARDAYTALLGFRSNPRDVAAPTTKADLLQTPKGSEIAPLPGPWYNQRPGNLNQDLAGGPLAG